jgi:hypothetical protein
MLEKLDNDITAKLQEEEDFHPTGTVPNATFTAMMMSHLVRT